MIKIRLNRNEKIIGVVAVVHLILVAFGASQWRPWEETRRIARPLDFYGTLSGASSGYGFFAPGVSSQLRGRFDVYRADGTVSTESMETGTSREADIRIGNLLGWFWSPSANQAIQRSLAASWAGKVYGRHPEATKVGVRLESYELVSMAEYRQGKRPQWKPLYEAKFVKRAASAKGAKREPAPKG